MALTSAEDTAKTVADSVNSGEYDADTNPYGLGGGGHVDLFPASLAAVATLASGVATRADQVAEDADAAATAVVTTTAKASEAGDSATAAAASAAQALAATFGPESDVSVASLTTSGGVTVGGDLLVSGSTVTVNAETVQVTDNTLVLNHGEVGPGVTAGTAGIEVDRGTETAYRFVFRESDDAFVIGEADSEQAVATREDSPTDTAIPYWNATAHRLDGVPGLTWDGSTLSIPTDLRYTQASYTETDHGEVTPAVTLALADGEVQTLTLTADTVITLPDPPAGRGYTLTLHIIQDTTGGWTPTIQDSGGTAVRWAYDTAPVWQTDAGARDVVVLMHGTAGLMGVHAGGWSS